MIYHSTHSDDYLWYLILREKKEKKLKHTRIQSSSTIFKWSEQNNDFFCNSDGMAAVNKIYRSNKLLKNRLQERVEIVK